jgi:ABC-2 type transport system ATP-binding protein
MEPLLVIEHLSKRFGPIVAVDDVGFTLCRGEVLGFLGPNGAGKSTTMRMITGYLAPSSGRVTVCGLDLARAPIEVRRRIGYLPEGAPAYGDMTPLRLLEFVAALRGYANAARRERIDAMIDLLELKSVVHQPIETLSKGFKRRLGLATALLHDPEVLILDEPTDGLDPNQKHHVRQLITDMAKEKAIIVSTHILEEVEAVCTRAVVINRGRIVADGTAEDLMRRLPYHGAVAIRVASDKSEAVKGALAAIAGIVGVETVSSANGKLLLRALPRNGAGIVTDVASVIRQKGLVVDEVFVERGKLDDVFRQITSSDLEKS